MNNSVFLSDINKILNVAVNRKFQSKLDELLKTLKKHISIFPAGTLESIVNTQRYSIKTMVRLTQTKKPRIKRDIDIETRCMARIGLGSQCSRSRVQYEEYCRSHIATLPYGRIDHAEISEKKMMKKRGRRGKNVKEYTVDDLDLDKYVQAILVKIDDIPYLLDQNNVLFQYNTDNEIVGYIKDEKVHWY